jgi:RNA polymerase sigma-70 factor (ECF subfamily)
MLPPTDAELLELLHQDDPRAIRLLFELHYHQLHRVACRIVGNQEVVKDIVQEVYVAFWEGRNRLSITSSIAAYLIKMTTNRSLNHLRNSSKTNTVALETSSAAHATAVMDAHPMEHQELKDALARAINTLPPKCKAVFILSRHEAMNYRTIAYHLDISEKTVEKHMSKALKLLHQAVRMHLNATMLFILPLFQ